MTRSDTPEPVAFPAMCVPRDFGVYVVRSLAQLRRTRASLFWRYGHFEGLRLFDSDGRMHEVMEAVVSRPTSGLGRAVARWLDLPVTVDVRIAAIGPASLADLITAVERAIEIDPESFEELSGRSVEWWQGTLGRVSTVRELIEAAAAGTR